MSTSSAKGLSVRQPRAGLARRRVMARRAGVAVLAVLCFVILSVYLRESPTGPLHRVQDAVGGLIAPVQGVAVDAIAPFQDAWGWFNDLRDARERAAALEEQVAELRAAAVAEGLATQDQAALVALEVAVTGLSPEIEQEYDPVLATVDGRPPTALYHRARIDVGSADGVVRNAPVIAGADHGGALLGKVTSVSEHSSNVSFITDGGSVQVGATVVGAGPIGIGLVSASSPGQLELTNVPREAALEQGQAVVTAGSSTMRLPSVYPRGLTIGTVTSVGSREVDAVQSVQVTPAVDPRSLHHMLVLTPDSERARRRASG